MEGQWDCASQLTHMHVHCLARALSALRTENQADVILVCGNVQFPAHKIVLKANSCYFKGMFDSDMMEAASGKVLFKEMEPETLQIVLDFMYLGDVSKINCEEYAYNVLAASHILQLEKLFEYCCKYLVKVLSCQNFHDIWKVGQKYDRHDLCTDVLFYVIANISEVTINSEFLFLSHDKVRDLLKMANRSPHITDEILLCILKWLCHDLQERQVHADELLSCVNPKFVTRENVKSLLKNEFVTLPVEILDKMEQLGWLMKPYDQELTNSSVSKPVAECAGVRLIYFSEYHTKKQFDSLSNSYIKCKVHGCCVQSLDLYTMTWLPPQKLPILGLKGAAMCQHRDKIYMVGGNLKSFYVMYDVAANSVEYVNCTLFDGKHNGVLCAVKGLLYFIERNTEGKLCRVTVIEPGQSAALGISRVQNWPSAAIVASKNFLYVYYSGGGSVKSSCRFSVTDKKVAIESNLVQIPNISEDEMIFFAISDNVRYGFYESNGDLIRLKYDATAENWVSKVFPKCPSNIREVTSIYRSSEDHRSLVFVSTGSKPYEIPEYLLDLETCRWETLPPPSSQCYIPQDEIIQKVYFVDSYY